MKINKLPSESIRNGWAASASSNRGKLGLNPTSVILKAIESSPRSRITRGSISGILSFTREQQINYSLLSLLTVSLLI